MSNPESWRDRPADGKYLVDAGLLYFINLQFLHPLGLALTVNKEGGISIKDCREHPEQITFPREVVVAGYAKFRRFMEEYGNKQMDIRTDMLGWATQPQIYGEK